MSTGTANAFSHPKLNELLQTATQTPFIGQILANTVRELIHPADRILVCYSQIETSGATAEREFTYYQIDVVLVTTAYYIRILFFPKTHTCVKKRIHTISEMKVEYPAPPMDDLMALKTTEFIPARVKLETHFANDKGAPVETWVVEASEVSQVRHVMEINRSLGRVVGVPLSQAIQAGAAVPAPANP